MAEVKHLTIIRSRWLRGENALPKEERDTQLLRLADGKMCCLGFLAIACGAHAVEILSRESPENAPDIDWPEGMLLDADSSPKMRSSEAKMNSSITEELMIANDEVVDRSYKRERKLKRLFKKSLGIEVVFKGKTKVGK